MSITFQFILQKIANGLNTSALNHDNIEITCTVLSDHTAKSDVLQQVFVIFSKYLKIL